MYKLICLMPTYNKEKTLARAIESVVMQKTDFEYKLIILDDCSTDDSNKIATEYKRKYPDKVNIVRNEKNLRLLKTITNGYSLLKGVDYFCVLDADDWYLYDKKFQDAVEFLDTNKDFSMYMTNINLLKNGDCTLWINNNKKVRDFTLLDFHKGKGVFSQTSGVIYKNLYFKNGMNEAFLNATQSDFGDAYRADSFRNEWHLHNGKAHFENHVESVYNYNNEGIWASLTEFEQKLFNSQMFVAFANFFETDRQYYLEQAQELYDDAILLLKENTDYIEKNKDLIFRIYKSIYLNKDYRVKTHLEKKYILRNIFSITNSNDKKYKITTILGLKIKIRRKL